MKPEIKYIELKSGFSHDGPAWIGLVSFSGSGRTLYFDGKAFQTLAGKGISGNYYNIETGEEYWISGPKKNMTDRHRFGSGKICIEERILEDYLKLVGRRELDKNRYSLCGAIEELPIARIHEYENLIIEKQGIQDRERFKNASDMTDTELRHFIAFYEETIPEVQLKARKSYREALIALKAERAKRAMKQNR